MTGRRCRHGDAAAPRLAARERSRTREMLVLAPRGRAHRRRQGRAPDPAEDPGPQLAPGHRGHGPRARARAQAVGGHAARPRLGARRHDPACPASEGPFVWAKYLAAGSGAGPRRTGHQGTVSTTRCSPGSPAGSRSCASCWWTPVVSLAMGIPPGVRGGRPGAGRDDARRLRRAWAAPWVRSCSGVSNGPGSRGSLAPRRRPNDEPRPRRRWSVGCLPQWSLLSGLLLLCAGIADAATTPTHPAATGAETWVVGAGGDPLLVRAQRLRDGRLRRRPRRRPARPGASSPPGAARARRSRCAAPAPFPTAGSSSRPASTGVYELGPAGPRRRARGPLALHQGATTPSFKRAFSAVRLRNGNTLIADRDGFRVIEVTPGQEDRLVVRHRVSPVRRPGSLTFPFSATRVEDPASPAYGHTIIADGGNAANKDNGSFRVIEIDDHGQDRLAVRARRRSTTDPGGLASPRWAEIVRRPGLRRRCLGRDRDADRPVDQGDHLASTASPDRRGQRRVCSSGPAMVTPLPGGTILIADTDGNRVLEVDPDGSIVDVLGADPFTPDGVSARTTRAPRCAPPRARRSSPTRATAASLEVGYPSVGHGRSPATSISGSPAPTS